MMTCTAKELCAATGGTLVQDGEGFSCVSTDSRRVEPRAACSSHWWVSALTATPI